MKDAFFGEERDKIAYLWQNSMDEATRVITMDLTFFVETDTGLYRRFQETHVQRAHTREELVAWLGEAGFTDIRVYGDRTMNPPGPDEQRIHLKKKKA